MEEQQHKYENTEENTEKIVSHLHHDTNDKAYSFIGEWMWNEHTSSISPGEM